MNLSTSKMRGGGRSSNKGRAGGGVYGMFKGQDEEQLLAGSSNTSIDGLLAGARPDELMQPPDLVGSGKGEEPQQLGSERAFDLTGAAINEVTNMLQDADLKEPKGQAVDLNATAVHHQTSAMQATMQSTPAGLGGGEPQVLNVSRRALDHA